MPKFVLGFACVAFAATVTLAPAALAFCRSTTCNPKTEACSFDARGCNTDGPPLYWDGGEVSLNVAAEGSPLRDIDADAFEAATTAAMETWQNVSCAGGKKPALTFAPAVLVEGPSVGFVPGGENENVVVFQDEEWHAGVNAIAETSLAFYERTGILIDTDIALNSQGFDFATSGSPGPADLQAVLTHEVGHVLGIDHSDVPGATMVAESKGSSTVALRSLAQDDIDAVCSIYPPAEDAADGGCTLARKPAGRRPATLVCLAALGAVALVRRPLRKTKRA